MTDGSPALTPSDQKRRVALGYDQVSVAYRGDHYGYETSGYARMLGRDPYECETSGYARMVGRVLPELRPADHVVELGCGCGVPATQILSEHCCVTGADISAVQLSRARTLVPAAQFVRADMATLHFRPASLRAVVALWSIIHVPLEEQPALLARVLDWLEPGGLFLATVGFREWTGSEDDWCDVPGATMYWSHADRATYLRWFEAAGFLVEHEDFIPEGNSGATVFFARKPHRPAPSTQH